MKQLLFKTKKVDKKFIDLLYSFLFRHEFDLSK